MGIKGKGGGWGGLLLEEEVSVKVKEKEEVKKLVEEEMQKIQVFVLEEEVKQKLAS